MSCKGWYRTSHVKKTNPPKLQWKVKEPAAALESAPAVETIAPAADPVAALEAAHAVETIAPAADPVAALESALADVEELLGEKLDSTRALLEHSARSASQAVTSATSALELLTKKDVHCKTQHDLQHLVRAKKSMAQLLLWRNFGFKMCLAEKPDPTHFDTYDADVQADLRQNYTKIEQMLLHELMAGDSWAKLSRNFRLQNGQKKFSPEMRALLGRIINTYQLTQDAKKRNGPVEALSDDDRALFRELKEEEKKGSQVLHAFHNGLFRHQEAMYPGYADDDAPTWMQQMLQWQAPGPMVQPTMFLPPSMPSSSSCPHPWADQWPPVDHWADPWPPGLLPSTASSSSNPQWVHPFSIVNEKRG